MIDATPRNRVRNWNLNLHKTLNEWSNTPFVWGQTDCFQFAGSVIESMTGTNHALPYAKTYNSSEQAIYEITERLGEYTLQASLNWWAKKCGTVLCHNLLMKGDLVISKRKRLFIHGFVIDSTGYITRNSKAGGYVFNRFAQSDLGVAI